MNIASLEPPVDSMEERILRILYEGPASLEECRLRIGAELRKPCPDPAVERTFRALVGHAYVVPHGKGDGGRYALSPRGSERLACLVEGSAQPEAE